mmetsp:Transcript_33053/g.105497  ORF Transcript_33053/g.105497 Transcript_33053/m.105497 type:complete len:347 (-) Transcript_33053:257-1297(-)
MSRKRPIDLTVDSDDDEEVVFTKTRRRVNLKSLAREREGRKKREGHVVTPPKGALGWSAPMAFSWAQVQKHAAGQASIDYLDPKEAEEASRRNGASTWCWSVIGVVEFRPDGALRGYGDKTQLSAFGGGVYKPAGPQTIADRRTAHVEAFAAERDVDGSFNPVGGSQGVAAGHSHNWVYANSERGPPPMKLLGGDDDDNNKKIRLTDFVWDELKGDHCWKWKWSARWTGGVAPGFYVLVADQNATRLRQGRKLAYLTRMLGVLLPMDDPRTGEAREMRRPTAKALKNYLASKSLPPNFTGGNNDARDFATFHGSSSSSSSSSRASATSASMRRQAQQQKNYDNSFM